MTMKTPIRTVAGTRASMSAEGEQGSKGGTMAQPADVPSTRYALDNATVRKRLGPLRALSGTWEGRGFNLIARPDFRDKANLYLQLNQTHETLTITPIRSAIPNRGFGQDDIELFGLSYLQKIHDHHTGGALHLEPGLWITQPCTSTRPVSATQWPDHRPDGLDPARQRRASAGKCDQLHRCTDAAATGLDTEVQRLSVPLLQQHSLLGRPGPSSTPTAPRRSETPRRFARRWRAALRPI